MCANVVVIHTYLLDGSLVHLAELLARCPNSVKLKLLQLLSGCLVVLLVIASTPPSARCATVQYLPTCSSRYIRDLCLVLNKTGLVNLGQLVLRRVTSTPCFFYDLEVLEADRPRLHRLNRLLSSFSRPLLVFHAYNLGSCFHRSPFQ